MRRSLSARTRVVLGSFLLLALGAIALPWAYAEGPAAIEKELLAKDADETLPLGRECTVVLEHGEAQVALTGRLEKANDRWLVLHAEIEGRSQSQGVPMLGKVPYVSRLYKNVGVGRSKHDYWIPRDRVLYLQAADTQIERIGVDFDFEIEAAQ